MKYIFVLLLAFLGCNTNEPGVVTTQNSNFSAEDTSSPLISRKQSSPVVLVTDATSTGPRGAPLKVSFSIKPDGLTPLVLEQNQISIHIKTENRTDHFIADPVFAKDTSEPIRILPGNAQAFEVDVLADRFGDWKTWQDLPDGRYAIQIYVNSGKSQKHENQWLGQTYSKKHELVLPIN